MELEDVIKVLQKKNRLKAKDLHEELPQRIKKKISKSDLNSFLYRYQNVYFLRNSDYSWELMDGRAERVSKTEEAEERPKSGRNVFQVKGKH